MKLFWVFMTLLLGGCVVVIPSPPHPPRQQPYFQPRAEEHVHEIEIKLPDGFGERDDHRPIIVTAPSKPPPSPSPPSLPRPEPCDRFEWPPNTEVAPRPSFLTDVLTDRSIAPTELNGLLLDYIDELRGYMEENYRLFQVEYQSYLRRCGYDDAHDYPTSLYEH